MPTVELQFPAVPAHVRTARLTAGVMAREAGVAEELLDEVRLAVGEACSRAVEVHRVSCPDRPVPVRLVDGPDFFRVEVDDCASAPEGVDGAAAALGAESGGPVEAGGSPAALRLAVIRGLVDDVAMTPHGSGLTLAMTWPAHVEGHVPT